MAIVVKLDVSSITEKVEGCIDDDAKLFFYNEFYREMKQYVPADTEVMYTSAVVTPEGIHFIQPYSSYPYFGITKSGKKMNFKTDHHLLATDNWDKAAWAEKKETLTSRLQKYIRERNQNNG